MGSGTTSRYSEENFKSDRELIIITSSVIAVEIFVYLLVNNESKFTVCDLTDHMYGKFNMNIKFDRMQQIMQDLVLAGKVKKDKFVNEKKKLVNYYSFKTLNA